MAKKMNSLAGDFEGINKAADKNVLALLNENREQRTQMDEKLGQVKKSDSQTAKPKTESKTSNTKQSAVTKTKAPKHRKAEKWGKPVAHFNTRIPEEMSELLDDLVYKLRKKGAQRTKQDLAHEALHDLLRKHSIC